MSRATGNRIKRSLRLVSFLLPLSTKRQSSWRGSRARYLVAATLSPSVRAGETRRDSREVGIDTPSTHERACERVSERSIEENALLLVCVVSAAASSILTTEVSSIDPIAIVSRARRDAGSEEEKERRARGVTRPTRLTTLAERNATFSRPDRDPTRHGRYGFVI